MSRPKININQKKCEACQVLKDIKRDFIATNSFMYPSGRTSVCRDCTYSAIKDSSDPTEALKEFLANINKPFIFSEWNEDISKYLSKINLGQYKSLTYSDSEFEHDKISFKKNDSDDKTEISKELKLFWHGHNDESIPILENNYQELVNHYPSKTPMQRKLYKYIAVTQYKIDIAKDSETKDLISTYSKLMQDANIKPVQDSEVEEGDVYGVWIQKIENDEPIPEAIGDFRDPDKIEKYVGKFFTTHISRMLGVFDKLANLYKNEDQKDE